MTDKSDTYKAIEELINEKKVVSEEEVISSIDGEEERVRGILSEMVENEEISKFKEDDNVGYRVKNNVFGESSGVKGEVQGVKVNRDYDWGEYVEDEDDVESYLPSTNEELRDVLTAINMSVEPARIHLHGPTGSGKTLLARFASAYKGYPIFTIQGHHRLRKKDLVGSRGTAGDEIVYDDGPLTKALLCSQDRPVVVLFDEINRSPTESKSFFYSVLDDRAELSTGIGDEKIVGNKDNLIAIATSNLGDIYDTNDFDPAEFDRFTRHIEVPYTDESRPSEVAEKIVAPRCGIDTGIANYLVSVANQIRSCVNARENTSLRKPLSTRRVIVWATESKANADMDYSNPIYDASQQVISPLYMDNNFSNDSSVIDSILNSTCSGLPLDRDKFMDVKGESPEKAAERLNEQSWREIAGD